jgi:hypothetical protein
MENFPCAERRTTPESRSSPHRTKAQGQESEVSNEKHNYQTRALMLLLRLNQQAMLYTPLSNRGLRAKRIMQRLAVRMAAA